MQYQPFHIYHIYNQGNNRQRIFDDRDDYLCFLNYYKRLFPSSCDTLAWCLMPNHFHFLVYTDERCSVFIRQGAIFIDPITNNIRKLLSGYARIYNNKYSRTGSLFRQKTKKNVVMTVSRMRYDPSLKTDYYQQCFHYIHQNPVSAGLCNEAGQWEFSSFRDYEGTRNGNLCNLEWGRMLLGE